MKLATLNINNDNDAYGQWRERRTQIASLLHTFQVDVAALQDVKAWTNDDQGRELVRLLPGFRSEFFPARSEWGASLIWGEKVERLTVSRQPLEAPQAAEDPTPRQIVRFEASVRGSLLNLINVHLSWVKPQNEADGRKLLSFVEPFLGLQTVIAGDFNVTPDARTIVALQDAGWTDAWEYLQGNQGGFTFPARDPSLRIDYMFLSPQLLPFASGLELLEVPGKIKLSDHLGLALTLAA